MRFTHCKVGKNTIMIYGFHDKGPHFSMVMTLIINDSTAKAHGFHANHRLELIDFRALWNYIVENIKIQYMSCKVLPEHAPVYEYLFPVIMKRKSKTFNGFPCLILKWRLK